MLLIVVILYAVSLYAVTYMWSAIRTVDTDVIVIATGLKISFTGPSDKMSGDVEFGSDICPMTFSSVLTWK
jgi:hypothetical protein